MDKTRRARTTTMRIGARFTPPSSSDSKQHDFPMITGTAVFEVLVSLIYFAPLHVKGKEKVGKKRGMEMWFI